MLGLGLSRLLPDSLRPSIVKTVMSAIERHKAGLVQRRFDRMHRSAGRAFVGNRVAVIGMLTANCGLGRGARLMIEDFRARGILVIPVDVTRALGDPADVPYPDAVLPSALAEYRPSDVIIHHNPPKFAGALALLSPTVLRSATIVGYWTWELERVPARWQNSARWCDEIWVPSQFVANALAASQTIPTTRLRVVPHAVDRDPMPPLDAMRRRIARHNIGIPIWRIRGWHIVVDVIQFRTQRSTFCYRHVPGRHSPFSLVWMRFCSFVVATALILRQVCA